MFKRYLGAILLASCVCLSACGDKGNDVEIEDNTFVETEVVSAEAESEISDTTSPKIILTSCNKYILTNNQDYNFDDLVIVKDDSEFEVESNLYFLGESQVINESLIQEYKELLKQVDFEDEKTAKKVSGFDEDGYYGIIFRATDEYDNTCRREILLVYDSTCPEIFANGEKMTTESKKIKAKSAEEFIKELECSDLIDGSINIDSADINYEEKTGGSDWVISISDSVGNVGEVSFELIYEVAKKENVAAENAVAENAVSVAETKGKVELPKWEQSMYSVFTEGENVCYYMAGDMPGCAACDEAAFPFEDAIYQGYIDLYGSGLNPVARSIFCAWTEDWEYMGEYQKMDGIGNTYNGVNGGMDVYKVVKTPHLELFDHNLTAEETTELNYKYMY